MTDKTALLQDRIAKTYRDAFTAGHTLDPFPSNETGRVNVTH